MVKVEHLTKYYGDFPAVNDLSFEISEGQVYGFLGPNGAGKSTTMNILTGCLSPSAGTVLIDGHNILEEPREAKKCIGYLPEHPPLYLSETPEEYLRFVGEAKGLKGAGLREGIEEVIEKTGLTAVRDHLISTLSKGYCQRVGIAQALLGNPKLIILDEPTVGLDPIQIIEIRELIKSLGENHTVIFSSHILSEVQSICAEVLIISGGKLVAFDTPENLEKMQHEKAGVLLTVIADREEAEAALGSFPEEDAPSCEILGEEDGCVRIRVGAAGRDLRKLSSSLFFNFAEHGLPIIEMIPEKANLEDVFVGLTEDTPGQDSDEAVPAKIPADQDSPARETSNSGENSPAEEKEVKEA